MNPEEPPPGQRVETVYQPTAPEEAASNLAETLPREMPAATCVPRMIGRFEVLRKLGEGGMGVVWEARDTLLNRTVALKVIRREVDEYTLIPLRHEADLMARLNHPNILKVFDIQLTGETPFIAMEYAEGGSLDRRLNKEAQPPRWSAQAVETLARAVHYLHTEAIGPGAEGGIIHRDLKPHNILLMNKGGHRPDIAGFKISDFGLAKDVDTTGGTTTRAGVGTLAYMSPEQTMSGTPLTRSVDVYALGVILYEMLTGHTPFTYAKLASPEAGGSHRGSSDLVAYLQQIRWEEPTPPGRLVPRLPRDLETICLKCLRKQPGNRYLTAKELADDLHRWLNDQPIEARRTRMWERAWLRCRRRPWEAAVAAFGSLAFVALVVMGVSVWKQRQEAKVAERIRDQHTLAVKALGTIRDLVQNGELNRPDGLDRLGNELIAYYDKLDQTEASEDIVATETFNLAKLIGKIGNKSKAIEVFNKAQAHYDSLVKTSPNADVRDKLARTHLEQGILLTDQGNYDAARPHFEEALRIWTAALDAPGANKRSLQRQIADTHHERGVALNRENRLDEALAEYDIGLKLRESLVANLPREEANIDDYRNVARSHGYMGDVYRSQGRIREADQAYWKSHRERERIYHSFMPDASTTGGFTLKMQPTESRFARMWDEAEFQLARSWMNFTNLQIRMRVLNSALENARNACVHLENIRKRESRDTEFRIDIADAHNLMAELYLLLGDPTEAIKEAKTALEQFEPLTRENERDWRIQRGFAAAQLLFACLRIDERDGDTEARRHLTRAEEMLRKLSADQSPATLYLQAKAKSLACELRKADPREAVKALDRAVESGFRDRHPDDVSDDRAFKLLRNDDAFRETLQKMHRPITVKASGT